ncbi:hypothetical protein GOBAR_AA33619 [Gossypium barbadense]|uniref:Uncharacterized protein n=1 Tax=Gossypium barbadense TaxID=3634 RepID=A0A2P5W7M4_GOSBA|nr:hypothetical protein GOBAR_AA33619 [Gossypium barbadense]
MALLPSGQTSYGSRDDVANATGWYSSTGGGPKLYSGPSMVHPFASTWDKWLLTFAMVDQPSARVPNFFNGCDIGVGQEGQSIGPNAGAGTCVGANIPPAVGPQFGPSSLGHVGTHRLPTTSHGVGPYSRPSPMDQILSQYPGPNANLVGLENVGQGGQSVGPNARAGPCFGVNMPRAMGPQFGPSSLGHVGAHKLPTTSHRVRPYSRPSPMDQILGQSPGPNANLVGLAMLKMSF